MPLQEYDLVVDPLEGDRRRRDAGELHEIHLRWYMDFCIYYPRLDLYVLLKLGAAVSIVV